MDCIHSALNTMVCVSIVFCFFFVCSSSLLWILLCYLSYSTIFAQCFVLVFVVELLLFFSSFTWQRIAMFVCDCRVHMATICKWAKCQVPKAKHFSRKQAGDCITLDNCTKCNAQCVAVKHRMNEYIRLDVESINEFRFECIERTESVHAKNSDSIFRAGKLNFLLLLLLLLTTHNHHSWTNIFCVFPLSVAVCFYLHSIVHIRLANGRVVVWLLLHSQLWQ